MPKKVKMEIDGETKQWTKPHLGNFGPNKLGPTWINPLLRDSLEVIFEEILFVW